MNVPQTFTITVTDVDTNEPPTIAAALPDVTVNQDAPDHVVDLSAFFTDPDIDDVLTFTVSDNNNASLVGTNIDGNTLTLDFLANQNGVADITIRATDIAGEFVEQTFTATVNPVVGQITGRVYHDLNANGTRDQGEPIIPGADVFLDFNNDGDRNGDEPLSETNNSGFYTFGNLFPGAYTVRQILEGGALQSQPADNAAHEVILAGGQNVTDRDFGQCHLAAILGEKFEDLDADGVKDEGEPGLAGFTIYLDLDNSGTLDEAEPNTVTNGQGLYSFTDLTPGTYTVAGVQQAGYVQTFPLNETGTHSFTRTSGQAIFDADFGNTFPGAHPDLVSQLNSTDLANTFVPGDKVDFDVIVGNLGQANASDEVTVRIYISTDGILDEDDILIAQDSDETDLDTGDTKRFRFRNVTIENIHPNQYRVITQVISEVFIGEGDLANNIFVTDEVRQLALQFGSFDGRENVELVYNGVEYSMRGPGFGEIVGGQQEGFSALQEGEDGVNLIFHDTTTRSTARIRTSDDVVAAVRNVTIHNPMGRLNFSEVNLHGNITALHELARIDLNDVRGPSTITIGNSKNTDAELKFYANQVRDLFIITGNAINRIDVADWMSTDGVQDVVRTRKITTFNADGLVDGLDLLVSREIGTFSADAMMSTNLLVGARLGFDGLPQTGSDLPNLVGLIKCVNLRGLTGDTPAFVNSRIAASTIKRASLNVVDTDNDGVVFGVAARILESLRRSGPALAFPTGPGDAIEGDFIVRLI